MKQLLIEGMNLLGAFIGYIFWIGMTLWLILAWAQPTPTWPIKNQWKLRLVSCTTTQAAAR